MALLAIAGVFVLDRIGSNGQEDQTIAQVRVIEPGEAKALLLLDDGTSINLEEIADSTIQTSGGTSIAKENEIIDYRQSRAKKVVYNTIRIPRGGEYTLVLSDGTKVYLNSDSELRYPVRFLGKERKVYLKGEGYLEVAENQEMPFIVDAMGIEVEVLGTEFNIKADAEDKKVETTLVEGRLVCYRTNHKEDATVLIPGYQAVATGTGEKLEVRKVDTRLYTSWKDGLFVFERLTLPEIFVTLGRWYNVEARFEDPALMNLHFTGDLERYENINTHLEMIGLTTHVKFEIEGETVYIRTE